MGKVRFGLVGAGAIGPSHITGITNVADAELAAICEKREDLKETLETRYEVPCFSAVSEMIESGRIDAITITTPSGFHLEPALAAIEAGKHVLVEKPMEITPERIDRMIEAAERKNVRLGGVFQSRFKPLPRNIKALLESGMLGEIYSGSAYHKGYRTQKYYDSGGWRGTWEIDGGGCLMNQGIHTVDLLLWMLGDVEELIGVAESRGRENVEVETLALSLLKFRNGARGVIEATTLAYPELPECLEIFGSRGTVTFNSEKLFRLELVSPTSEEERAREELLEEQKRREELREQRKKEDVGTVVTSLDMHHTPVIEDFVRAIRSGTDPFVDGREARRSVELITAIYRSAREGSRPVRLDPAHDGPT